MKQVAAVLLACGFTYVVAMCCGKVFLAILKCKLHRSEERFFGFVLGAACLSTLVFLLTAVGLARPPAFLATGVVIIGVAIWSGAYRFSAQLLPPLLPAWRLLFGVIYSIYAILYIANALLPEVNADAVIYHVPLIARYLREHQFVPVPTNLYANFPAGVEMLFLFAFAFGKHSAPATVHLIFTVVFAFGILSYGRRINSPVAGAVASLLVFLSPIVGKDGTTGYIDVAAGCLVFATFYALEIWREEQDPALIIPIGVLCGFCCATKYTLAMVIPFAVAYVAFYRRRGTQNVLGAMSRILLCALLVFAPWLVKNIIFTGNPISPLGNESFPNPNEYVWVQQAWEKSISTHLVPLWQLPFALMVDGRGTTGVIGPVFLLALLLILSLRRAEGRRLAAAAVYFSLVHLVTHEARFLIPVLPFVGLGLGLALAERPAIAAAVVILHGLLSWPYVLRQYTGPGAWRLDSIDVRAALRIQPESEYLRTHLPDYAIGLLMDQVIPPGEPVFGFLGVQECYQSHVVIGSWQSALGVRLDDAIHAPMKKELQPTRRYDYRFSARQASKVRLIQQATSSGDRWSITEMRFRYQGQEQPRKTEWRASASPNPWDAPLALDGSNVTRWTSGQSFATGMFFETDFNGSVLFDEVVVECTPDQPGIKMTLEVQTADGWSRVPGEPSISDAPSPSGLRRAAIEYFKANHVRWMVVHDLEPLSSDFREYAREWGITAVGAAQPYTLYRLD